MLSQALLALAACGLAAAAPDRPKTYDGLMALSAERRSRGRSAESVEAAEEALTLKPDGFEAELAIGIGEQALGRHDLAIPALEKASKLKPGDYWACVMLAQAYSDAGRMSDSERTYARAKKIDPHQTVSYILEGYSEVYGGEDEQGRRQFEYLIALDTSSPAGYHHLGAYYASHGRLDLAEAFLRKAAALYHAEAWADAPDVFHTSRVLASVLEREKRSAEAEQVYRSALEAGLRRGKSWQAERDLLVLDFASFQEAHGRPAEARKLLALLSDTSEQQNGFMLADEGRLLAKLGERERARQCYLRAKELCLADRCAGRLAELEQVLSSMLK